MADWALRILESAREMEAVEALQRLVWPGSETDVVPAHMLLAAVHNGGLVVGAVLGEQAAQGESFAPEGLVGFVYGFPGLYFTPDGPRPKHCSHMLGVHPGQRDRGIGFALKRAQWQMVRHQGLDRVTWTYDPLLSRNGQLNIAKLGAVCNTYRRDEYGEMRDGLNVGLPSDRFQVDWWVNTNRVRRRLSKRPRQALDLGHFLSAGAPVLNPAALGADGWPRPASGVEWRAVDSPAGQPPPALALVEIPADFPALKAANPELALEWRLHTRQVFEQLFEAGYLATDFISGRDFPRRSYYVLSYGESTL